MSESARGEGGRIWTYKDGKPWYFLVVNILIMVT